MELPKRKRIRLPEYDYSTPGYYFITVCTKDKRKILGEIVGIGLPDGPINALSDYGKVAQKQMEAMRAFYDAVRVEKYVIMPNRIHMLIHVLGNVEPEKGWRKRIRRSRSLWGHLNVFATGAAVKIYGKAGLMTMLCGENGIIGKYGSIWKIIRGNGCRIGFIQKDKDRPGGRSLHNNKTRAIYNVSVGSLGFCVIHFLFYRIQYKAVQAFALTGGKLLNDLALPLLDDYIDSVICLLVIPGSSFFLGIVIFGMLHGITSNIY